MWLQNADFKNPFMSVGKTKNQKPKTKNIMQIQHLEEKTVKEMKHQSCAW